MFERSNVIKIPTHKDREHSAQTPKTDQHLPRKIISMYEL